MNNEIENAIKTGRRYWFVDGFIEILGGLIFILLGAVLAQSSNLAGLDSRLAETGAILAGEIALVKLFGLLAGGLLVWWLKDHFTYPRSGYVRGRRPSMAQSLPLLRNAALGLLLPLLLLAAALAWLPGLQGLSLSLPAWSALLIGAIWGSMCLLAGRWLGLRRFELLGGLIVLAGLAICALQLAAGLPADSLGSSFSRTFLALGWLTAAAGMIFLVSGLVIFLRYRRANPQPFQDTP